MGGARKDQDNVIPDRKKVKTNVTLKDAYLAERKKFAPYYLEYFRKHQPAIEARYAEQMALDDESSAMPLVRDYRYFDDMHGTRIVKLDMSPALIEQLKSDLTRLNALDRQLKGIQQSQGKTNLSQYNPLSLYFENALLFSRGMFEHWHANKKTVFQNVDDLSGVQANLFGVPAGSEPYGLHNAGSNWDELKLTHNKDGCFSKQVSFHCTLSPVTERNNPFVLFDDACPVRPTFLASMRDLNASTVSEETLQIVKAIVHMVTTRSKDSVTAMQFMATIHLGEMYSAIPWPSYGYYWKTDPGEAVFFNNALPHGYNKMNNAEGRMTADFRVFSGIKNSPSKLFNNILVNSPFFRQINEAKDCIAAILGFSGGQEEISRFLGLDKPFVFHLTDLFLGLYGYYDGERQDLLADRYAEKMQRYYEQIGEIPTTLSPKAQAAVEKFYAAAA